MENLSTSNPLVRKFREGWGKLRRLFLCHFRPGAVREGISRRQGACRGCAECCDLLFRCPYLAEDRKCKIYEKRFKPCSAFPIDGVDVKHIDCGFYFTTEGADRATSLIPLAPWARREIALIGFASLVGGGAGLCG